MTVMDPLITKLKTAEECETFELNARKLGRLDLAAQAQKQALEYRAKMYGAATDVELECLKAVYAYEQVLALKNGKKTRAQRTWNMIASHGIIRAVERAVDRKDEAAGFIALRNLDLEEFAFEAVVLRYPEAFSFDVVERSRERLAEFDQK